jgi:hypothetical protein
MKLVAPIIHRCHDVVVEVVVGEGVKGLLRREASKYLDEVCHPHEAIVCDDAAQQ